MTPDCAVCDRPIPRKFIDDCDATHMDRDGHLVHADCCDCNQPGAETGARREIREGK